MTPDQQAILRDFDRLVAPSESQIAEFKRRALEAGISAAAIEETLLLKAMNDYGQIMAAAADAALAALRAVQEDVG